MDGVEYPRVIKQLRLNYACNNGTHITKYIFFICMSDKSILACIHA